MEHYLRRGTLVFYARAGDPYSQVGRIYELAVSKGANQVFILDPPSPPYFTGRHRIIKNEKDYRLPITKADGGVISKKGQALLMPTRDCHTLVLENMENGCIGAAHCGRESLINRQSPCCVGLGVVERLIEALDIKDGARVVAHIIGGIGAAHFGHTDWEYVRPFVELYGPGVVTDEERMTLDLVAVITAKLHLYGITKIVHDGLCTYEHPGLGSARANRTGSNWVIPIMK